MISRCEAEADRDTVLSEAQIERLVIGRLLLEATDALESDQVRTRRCLREAAALLAANLPRPLKGALDRERRGLRRWQIKALEEYVKGNLESKIQLSAMAARVGLSSSHFSRTFKNTFGTTPHDYIQQQRIAVAKSLMNNSRESLASIASGVGLCDQAHLTRMFRRVVGTTPSLWRQLSRSLEEARDERGCDLVAGTRLPASGVRAPNLAGRAAPLTV